MDKIRKGDQVQVLLGKDRGKKGKVERVLTKKGQIQVHGLNIIKKHVKPQGEGKPGGIIEITKPMRAAKVALVCPKCNQVTRVGFQLGKGELKQRVCRKCGQPFGK